MKNKPEIKKISFTSLMLLFFIVITPTVLGEDNFNLEVEIAETYKILSPGEDIWFTVKILNLANKERMDITLEYEILNEEGVLVDSKSETIAIETQASFVGSINLPQNSKEGTYNLNVKLIFNNKKEAESKDSFKIIKGSNPNIIKIILIITALLIISLIIYLIIKSKTLIEHHKIKSKIHRIIKKKSNK